MTCQCGDSECPSCGVAQGTRACPGDLTLVRSDQGDGGWSLNRPGLDDEQMADGDGILLCGTAEWDEDAGDWTRPNPGDYAAALRIWERDAPSTCTEDT